MNKKEMNTILKSYKTIYNLKLMGFDKDDSIREFKILLNNLGMEIERYKAENEIIAAHNNMSCTIIEMYEMIFNDFLKYGRPIHYDLKEIDEYYDYLEFKMTEEENACHKARINYINTHQ